MTIERAIGCLNGVAVGDALGMPSELWSREKVKRRFGVITDFLPGEDDHFVTKGYKAGQFTDDTAQALKISESLIRNQGKIDPTSIAFAILEWVEEVNAFETNALGPSSKKALMDIKNGVPVEEAGSMGDTNGAAMRIAPIAIISKPDNIVTLVDNVEKSCLGTHNTNIAIAGASMLAAAISTAMETKDWKRILHNANLAYDEGMTRGNDMFGASSKERLAWAIQWIDQGMEEEELMHKLYHVIGAGVATTEAVPTSIALAYYAKGDPIRASLLAANLGGDCDTIGAMTGGLCGAFTGEKGIPQRFVQKVYKVNGVNIEEIARQLNKLRA